VHSFIKAAANIGQMPQAVESGEDANMVHTEYLPKRGSVPPLTQQKEIKSGGCTARLNALQGRRLRIMWHEQAKEM
jgi:hypothetical protein